MPVAIVFDITGTPEMLSDCLLHVNYVVNIPGYTKQKTPHTPGCYESASILFWM